MTINKKIISFAIIVCLTVASFVAVPILSNATEQGSGISQKIAAESTDKTESVEENTDSEDIETKKVMPSVDEKLDGHNEMPVNTIIFYAGIAGVLGLILAIIALVALRKRKK